MRKLLTILFLSIAVVLIIVGFAASRPEQSMVQFAEAQSIDDFISGSTTVPIVLFYPTTNLGTIFVFNNKNTFSYVQIESSNQSFWIYESNRDIRTIDEVQEAIESLIYAGHHDIEVGDLAFNADMWRDNSGDGGAMIFSIEGTNIAFFWHKLSIPEIENILKRMAKVG